MLIIAYRGLGTVARVSLANCVPHLIENCVEREC